MAIEKSAAIRAAQSNNEATPPSRLSSGAGTLGGVEGNPYFDYPDVNIRNKQGITKSELIRKAQSKFKNYDEPVAPLSNSSAGTLGGVKGNPYLDYPNINIHNKQGIRKSDDIEESQGNMDCSYSDTDAPLPPTHDGGNYSKIEGVLEDAPANYGKGYAGTVDAPGNNYGSKVT